MDIASLLSCEFGMTCVACCSPPSVFLPDPMTSPSFAQLAMSKRVKIASLCICVAVY